MILMNIFITIFLLIIFGLLLYAAWILLWALPRVWYIDKFNQSLLDFIYGKCYYNIDWNRKRKLVENYFGVTYLFDNYEKYNNGNPFDVNNYKSLKKIIDPNSELGKEFYLKI